MSDLSLVAINDTAIAATGALDSAKNNLLIKASMIEQVTTPKENEVAVSVQSSLHSFSLDLEKMRKEITTPKWDFCTRVKKWFDEYRAPIDNAERAIGEYVAAFNERERERVRLENVRRAEEENRIQREKDAAIAKAAREQAELEAARLRAIQEKARAEAEAARQEAARIEAEAMAKRQAENAKQSAEQAEKNRLEWEAGAESRRIAAEKQQAEIAAKAEADAAAERARNDAALKSRMDREAELAKAQSEALGPEAMIARARGQRIKEEWVIDSVDIWAVVKARPDLCNVEVKMRELKEALNIGPVVGIKARKVTVTGTMKQRAINVQATLIN